MFNSSLHCLREKQIPNQNNTQIHNKSFRLQKQLKEFNYSSALTDSSWEENPNKRKQQKYKLNKKEYSREQRSRGNSYLHQSNLQSELSNHQNSLSINMLSGDVNNCSINSNFMLDTKMVPKIKLNTIVEKPKYSHSKGTVVNVNQSYKSNNIEGQNSKSVTFNKLKKSKFNASFDTVQPPWSIKGNQRSRRSKQNFSSCSFRNPQSLNRANFMQRRPSSTTEAKHTW